METVYTQFGYGMLVSRNEKMSQVQVDNITCFVSNQEVKSKITVRVKTLFGSREAYSFEVNIQDQIKSLVLLLEQKDRESIGQYHKLKFIYPMGRLQTLDLNMTFCQQKIKHDSQLVLMGTKQYGWDAFNKGSQMILSNQNKTIRRGQASHSYETALAELGFSDGRHYWEITLDAYCTEEDIFIGVSRKGIKYNKHASETPRLSWGWQCTSARKMWPLDELRTQAQPYGDYIKIGETIGVLLEFKNNIGSLSYCRKDGVSFGKAFESIPPGEYFPCVSLLNNMDSVIVTLNTTAKMQPMKAQKFSTHLGKIDAMKHMIPKSFPMAQMADLQKLDPQPYEERLKSIPEPDTHAIMNTLFGFGFVDFGFNLALCKQLNNDLDSIVATLSQ